MTLAQFETLRPKPWRWRRCKTSFALEDANGKVIGKLNLYAQKETNHHEWMRHVGQGMSDVTTVVCDPEAMP